MLVIISTAVTPAMAAGTKEAPTEVKSVMASGSLDNSFKSGV